MCGFDFMFVHDSMCLACFDEAAWPCSRLCSGNHSYEGAAVFPLLIFVFTAVLFGLPWLLYHEIDTVTKGIASLMNDIHRQATGQGQGDLSADELERWPDVLCSFRESAMEFVKPFRLRAAQWPLWQLVSPVVPSVVEVLTSLDIDVYGEIVLMVWSFVCLAALLFANPSRDTLSKIGNIILECTNVVLCLLPVVNRYLFAIPDLLAEIVGVVGVGIPLVLVIILPLIEWWKEAPRRVAPQSVPLGDIACPFAEERDALRRVFAERNASKAEKLCLAACGDLRTKIIADNIPLSALVIGLADASPPHELIRGCISSRDIALFASAIDAIRGFTFPNPGGLFEDGSVLAQTFPELRDRIRILCAELSPEQIAVLRAFLLSPDSAPISYQDAFEELWSWISDDPLLFALALTMPPKHIHRLKSRYRSGELANFTFEEQVELSSLDEGDLWFFQCDYDRNGRKFPLSHHDFFRVVYKWRRSSKREIVQSLDDLYDLATALQFGRDDVDAILCLLSICEADMELLLGDPDFSHGQLPARCLLYRLQVSHTISSMDWPFGLSADLPSKLALDMYYYACKYETDHRWIRHLLEHTAGVEEVERQYLTRRDLRILAPNANIDFRSTFLESIIPPGVGWRWWFTSFLVVPVAWFLGAKAVILQSILEADC
jgi:hypothetical protein